MQFTPSRPRWQNIEVLALLTRIHGGRLVDPANRRDEVADLWIRDGRIVAAPDAARIDELYDATGKIVMAGAIDIHSHIASDNVNRARLLLPDIRARPASGAAAAPAWHAPPPAFETGCLYVQMGFTTVVEPAVS